LELVRVPLSIPLTAIPSGLQVIADFRAVPAQARLRAKLIAAAEREEPAADKVVEDFRAAVDFTVEGIANLMKNGEKG
jgi:hypothetical protein